MKASMQTNLTRTPVTSIFKSKQEQNYRTPQAFKDTADKENCDPQVQCCSNKESEKVAPAESPSKESASPVQPEPEPSQLQSSDLPEVIADLSQALETSNNTVQSLKSQLETVLQREMTLQLEHEMLGRRYENLLVAKTQAEVQCREKEAKVTADVHQASKRVEDLQDALRQKNKIIELKNAEIAEFTQKLHNIMSEHNSEIKALGDEIAGLKNEIKRNENKQQKEKNKLDQISRNSELLRTTKETLESQLKDKDAAILRCNDAIKTLETKLAQSEMQKKTIEELQRTVKNLQSEKAICLADKQQELETLSHKIEGYADREHLLREEVAEKEEENKRLVAGQKECSGVKDKCCRLEKENAELRKGCEDKKAELMEIKEKSGKIQQRIEELRKIETDLRAEYNKAYQEKQKLADKCKAQDDQLVAAKDSVNKLKNVNKKKDYETEAQIAALKEKHEETIAKYKDELNKISVEKDRLAVAMEECGLSKQKIEEERRRHDIEVTQWKEGLLELATQTIKADVYKIQSALCISDKYKTEQRLPMVARVMQMCKDIIESQDDAPESVYMLKEALRNEKAKYLELHKRYHAELLRRRKLHNALQELKGNIRVMCRVRPLLYQEVKKLGDKSAGEWIQIPEECMITAANEEANKISSYEFDRVFSPKEGQDYVFEEVSPMITSSMDGYNVAILAYGQTGSGKTYTMEGLSGNEGITFRSIQEVFNIISERAETHKYEVSMTVVEVYNEKIRNLLDKRADKMELMENAEGKIKVVGLVPQRIANVHEAIKLFEIGKANRSVGVTNVNEYSSRSHSILTLHIKGMNMELKQRVKSRLDLVDLAGSERLSKSEAEGERMKEATNINLSLTTLGKVLNALAGKCPHVPYRDSKLTHLLKKSIGGDAKTLMIVQVSPNPGDVQESLSTLAFGNRVCGIEKGKAKKNTSKMGKKQA